MQISYESVCNAHVRQLATSRLAHLEKIYLNLSSSAFVIGVNLLHP